MSLSLTACHPRILDPSNPKPSSKTFSSSFPTGIVKCCQRPGKSMNRKSTLFTSFSRHSASTSRGFISERSLLHFEYCRDTELFMATEQWYLSLRVANTPAIGHRGFRGQPSAIAIVPRTRCRSVFPTQRPKEGARSRMCRNRFVAPSLVPAIRRSFSHRASEVHAGRVALPLPIPPLRTALSPISRSGIWHQIQPEDRNADRSDHPAHHYVPTA